MIQKKVVILGVGNLILKDEGVGIHIIKEMKNKKLPVGVTALDAGTASLDLLSVICESEKIIVIDALRSGEEPGTVYRCLPEELVDTDKESLSLHEIDLLDVLLMSRQLGGQACVVIIGVEPKEIEYGLELTPKVKAAVPRVIQAVFEELKEMGYA
jgi:hydrogenase maturation protease